ncbi:hypothetical protein D910_12549 [Dendroctonus ponderosae]|uniref:N-acetyltransferase domain-containing protein n=1 Tax=Dendroctonus ponderosae TaxID=77166 RepID=U4URX1_DENPD|nr:hypothetical protein D910_12549 [Dendroctonus ponderosae]
MEFRFDLNELFKQPIVEVGNTLIPPGFTGDKRALWDVQSKMSQIVNAIGEASAHAQGLSKPITTADRLRNSEYKLYLLMDPTANNGKGAVTGMLKTGTKGLYVFDRNGQHYQVSPQCVLDFYIHESRQRTGLGRRLFEHMLQVKAANRAGKNGDRPAERQVSRVSQQALRAECTGKTDEQLCGLRWVLSQDARNSGPCGCGQKQNYQTRPTQEADQSRELGRPGLTPQSAGQHYPGAPSTQTNQQMGFSTEGNQPVGVDNPPVGNSAGFNQMGDNHYQSPPAQPMRNDASFSLPAHSGQAAQSYQAQPSGQPIEAPSAHLLSSLGQAPPSIPSQTHMDGRPEFQNTNRVIQSYVTESPQLSMPRDPARSQQSEVDLSKGYPPQHFDEATPKADRPNSLNFEPPEEKLSEPEEEDQTVDGLIEEEIQKVTVAPEMERRGSKSPGPEAAGLMTPRDLGTQGLTDEGYFDLKFFHNRLW